MYKNEEKLTYYKNATNIKINLRLAKRFQKQFKATKNCFFNIMKEVNFKLMYEDKDNSPSKFEIFEKEYITEDNVQYKGYGIRAIEKGETKEEIEDISDEKPMVLALLKLLCENKASYIHLKDIVEDFLATME